ncbi:MAG: FlaG/FlaF family flagellin (archaellin) [Halobacteriales archaeon]|jgi:FlaG/FlaF family flagellin (archaellin)
MERDRGVSSAISTVFMVALGVILSATVAITVFSVGVPDGTAPQVVLEFSVSDTGGSPTVTITHERGNELRHSNIEVRGSKSAQLQTKPGDYSAGDVIVDAANVTHGETIKVIYQSGENTYVLGEFSIPGSKTQTTTTPTGDTTPPTIHSASVTINPYWFGGMADLTYRLNATDNSKISHTIISGHFATKNLTDNPGDFTKTWTDYNFPHNDYPVVVYISVVDSEGNSRTCTGKITEDGDNEITKSGLTCQPNS